MTNVLQHLVLLHRLRVDLLACHQLRSWSGSREPSAMEVHVHLCRLAHDRLGHRFVVASAPGPCSCTRLQREATLYFGRPSTVKQLWGPKYTLQEGASSGTAHGREILADVRHRLPFHDCQWPDFDVRSYYHKLFWVFDIELAIASYASGSLRRNFTAHRPLGVL